MKCSGLVITTDRLMLRVLDETAAGRVLDFYQRNRAFFETWDTLRDNGFYTLERQINRLKKDYARISAGKSLTLYIFKKDDLKCENVIGVMIFNNILMGSFQSCFLGYKMDQAETGRGYMKEAVGAAIRFVFDGLGLHRLEANIMPRNTPSLRLAKKLGFWYEGLAKGLLKVNGKWEDHVHMVLLNPALGE